MENTMLSGISHDKSYFHYFSSKQIQYEEILKVLKGEILGCIFNNIIPKAFCDKIYFNAFKDKDMPKEKVAKNNNDEAPPVSVGTQHYKKQLDFYLNEAERVLPELQNLFKNIKPENNFYYKFLNEFSQFLEPYNIKLRLAEHKGRPASPFWIRAFDASQEYMISPHDDVPQLRCPKQAGFEIQSVKDIIAVNICLENKNNGILLHYNLQPDDKMRKAFGVENTGYPYPLQILEDVEKIELEAKEGDFYFLNANNIHAVKTNKKSQNFRTTMSWFMGFKDKNTILYWI